MNKGQSLCYASSSLLWTSLGVWTTDFSVIAIACPSIAKSSEWQDGFSNCSGALSPASLSLISLKFKKCT